LFGDPKNMKKKWFVFPLVILVVLAMATTVFARDFTGVRLVASLTGAQERPGPGDPDGSGSAVIYLNYGQSQVCWQVSYENLDPAIAAHIHIAPVGVPGPVVVPLSPINSGCTTVNRDLIKAIIQHPDNYYVNVHTTVYPAGAIRGQLSRMGSGD
jgi:hypothetical protein